MRWSKEARTQYSVISSGWKGLHWIASAGYWVLLAGVTLGAAAPEPPPANEKHVSVYSPVAVYSIPIADRAGGEYVGLLDLLEPLGHVSSQSEGGHLRLRFNATDGDFAAGKMRARIRGHDLDLAAPFLIENSRGMVPVKSMGALLSRLVGTPVDFRENARRLFVGGVEIGSSVRLEAANPPRLLLSFSGPVNPTIATEPGKLRMTFKRDPVVFTGSQSIAFDNRVITHVTFAESHGDAEFEITADRPLLASFSEDRKTITVSAVPPAPSGAISRAPGSQATLPQANAIASGRRLLAVVDAAHGGDERGAALTDTLLEKDVTLGFARLLRHELELRGFAVTLLRDADNTSPPDQRAAAANLANAALYISLHAASQGGGACVYTALLPVEGASRGMFHPWNTAQAKNLAVSRVVAAAVVAQFKKSAYRAHAYSASLRPLNNVVMPAVAVELLPGEGGVSELASPNYQQRAAAAIADGVASVRDRLGLQP
jgi:N-acetylmuramoyl-L-alanine amidase